MTEKMTAATTVIVRTPTPITFHFFESLEDPDVVAVAAAVATGFGCPVSLKVALVTGGCTVIVVDV
jgi:hypothetical protein